MHAAKMQTILAGLTEITGRAGELIIEAAKHERRISYKGTADLVTETDVAVEEFLKKELARLLPEAGFLAEESASAAPLKGKTWIIDPVDGTTNFAHGLPFVATSVALWEGGKSLLGVVNIPLMNEMFSAYTGGGAWLNGNSIAVSETASLEHALLSTGFPYSLDTHLETVVTHMRALLPRCHGIRRAGAAAMDLAYVACGRHDGFYHNDLSPWDTAAGMLLVQEAGGCVTEYNGTTPYALNSPEILATNCRIHQELAGLL